MVLFFIQYKNICVAKNLINHDEDIFIKAEFYYPNNSNIPPKIIGTTNLPDNTKISINIYKKESGWFDDVKIYIKNGKFISDPLIGGLVRYNRHKKLIKKIDYVPISPGDYNLNFVSALPPFQPKIVQKIIGKNGEFLKGPLIKNYSNLNYIKFSSKINFKGEESLKQDNKVGISEMEKLELILLSEKRKFLTSGAEVPYRIFETYNDNIKPCSNLEVDEQGICYAEIKKTQKISNCKKSLMENEDKLNECLNDYGLKNE